MLFTDFGRSLTLFAVPLSAIIYVLTINLLYVVTFVAGVLTVFFEISYQSYVPSLVEREQIIDANSKLETSRASAQTFGPGIAGFVISIVSAPITVLADTFGYFASAVSLTLIKKQEIVNPDKIQQTVLSDLKQGLRVVFGDPSLRSIAGAIAMSNLASSAWGAISLKYFYQYLQMTVSEVGVAFSIGATGGILGALTAMRVTKLLGVGRTIIFSMLFGGAVMISLYFATPTTAFFVIVVSTFFGALGGLWFNIPQVSYRQSLVPSEIQGRMNATMRTIVWGTLPIGGLLGGVLAQTIGVHETIGIMTLLGALAFLWLVFSPVWKIKDFPAAAESEIR